MLLPLAGGLGTRHLHERLLLMSAPFLDDLPRFVFFTGKGGVGKTSLACATAVALAEQGRRVLLTSTDPASNVGQVFGVSVGNRITPVPDVPGLSALEIDPEQAAEAYRERIIGPVRGLLPEPEIASMTEQLSGSCTTEIASFNEFTGLLGDTEDTRGFDHVVFDTAPTGHTIRLLQLPGEWTEFLDRGKGDASCLGPMAGLERQRTEYARAVEVLGDPALTRLVLVARAQPSSLAEVARTSAELADVGMREPHLVINALMPETGSGDRLATALREREQRALAELPGPLAGLSRTEIGLLPVDTMGVDALRLLLANPAETSLGAPSVRTSAEPAAATDDASLPDLVDAIEADGNTGLIMCMGKGGVGKTTIAAAIAVALAARGHRVHLTTTDPAAHLTRALPEAVEGLETSRIDPEQAVADYRGRIMATQGKGLDDAGRAVLQEDLRSPCTEEIAVFQQFSKAVAASRRHYVVMDTAPTGHTLLLMDATGSYHRQMARQMGAAAHYTTPLMRLQDPAQTKVVIVTLPETTPVLEATDLQDDLRRADIEPWAWVVNHSLFAAAPTDPLLTARAAAETGPVGTVYDQARRVAIVPALADEPVGAAALLALSTSSIVDLQEIP
ncbi:arsenical pump-driving ATPase [Mobilicoccus caccae]|uniref:Arsenical pump-driving ATPase n=1 Tax=Mobilicoccus caccae TaxID=1859295 RepID=A0ABQ6IQF6_9MICO|nr:arsenical pump-driving ATPase [Mobilicoccus caccae]GMA38954.1 arsenical pump-driving ATPase [Mobilicoccus caccae]